MSGRGAFSLSAHFRVGRRAWIAAGLGLLLFIGLSIWGALAAISWMWGQSEEWSRGAASAAAREWPARRDVMGMDPGPVARYPGLARTYWHREGARVTAIYEGAAERAAVLEHYRSGFAVAGFAPTMAAHGETLEFSKDRARVTLKAMRQPRGQVSVRVEVDPSGD